MGTAQGTVDAVALVYAIVVFPAPFFWLIVHPAIRFWRRFGNRSFWVALPLWTFSGTCLVLLRHRIFAERIGRNPLTTIAGVALIALAVWIGHHVHRRLGLQRLLARLGHGGSDRLRIRRQRVGERLELRLGLGDDGLHVALLRLALGELLVGERCAPSTCTRTAERR